MVMRKIPRMIARMSVLFKLWGMNFGCFVPYTCTYEKNCW